MLAKLFSFSMIAYVFSVVAVNVGFSVVPLIPTPFGLFSPMAIVVGAIFVIRDFAQRSSGHYVLVGMALGTLFSYGMADPYVATASAAAFVTSEVADYLLYTFTAKPFYKRVLISSAVSTPIDTLVFLFGINNLTVGTFVIMVLSKMIAAVVIWAHYRNRVETPLVAAQPSKVGFTPSL